MTPKDWTLLVLASAGGPLSPVQLQKTLFLIDRNLSRAQRGVTRFYNFRAYDYTDAVILQTEGRAMISDSAGPHRQYAVTPAGMADAAQLRRALEPNVLEYVDRAARWVRSMPFRELVRAIYAQYPEMRANSVFRG